MDENVFRFLLKVTTVCRYCNGIHTVWDSLQWKHYGLNWTIFGLIISEVLKVEIANA